MPPGDSPWVQEISAPDAKPSLAFSIPVHLRRKTLPDRDRETTRNERRWGAVTFFLRPLPDFRPGVVTFFFWGVRPFLTS